MSRIKSGVDGSIGRDVWLGIVVSLIILASVLPLWCEEQDSAGPFWNRLREQLREQHWQEQEIGALQREAQRFNWANTQEADSRIVARALQFAKSYDDLDIPIKARLTYELALGLSEMSSVGYSVRTRTRMALSGTRDVIQKLRNQSFQSNAGEVEPDGVLREMIRVTLRSRFRADARDEVQLRVRDGIGGQKHRGRHQGDGTHNPFHGQNGDGQHGGGQNGGGNGQNGNGGGNGGN